MIDVEHMPDREPFARARSIDRLELYRYTATFVAEEALDVPAHRLPNILRGSFEMAYRRLVCHDVDLDCRACPLREVCTYPALFRPAPPPGSERLSKQQDLPRPFVLMPLPTAANRLAVGDKLTIQITLFGSANRALPYFVVALRALADRGLGRYRARLNLVGVVGQTPGETTMVFDRKSSTVSTLATPTRVPQLLSTADFSARRVHIRFRTPTTIKRDGHWISEPRFSDLVCRLRDRLNALATFFGDGPLDIDFLGLARRADEIRTTRCDTHWNTRVRRSARTGHVHELSGFTGEATYEGDLSEWMPLLRAGEVIHVGKYTAWGNGAIEVGIEGPSTLSQEHEFAS